MIHLPPPGVGASLQQECKCLQASILATERQKRLWGDCPSTPREWILSREGN